MIPQNIDVFLENKSLKNEFSARGLDLSQVFYETPDDLRRENRVLRALLDWVQKYTECGDRKLMEAGGYDFPPIDPDFCPDNDWYRFERWLQGKPIRQKLRELLPPTFTPAAANDLTDNELLIALEELADKLADIHFAVDLVSDIPPRLLYEHLLECLDEEYDVIDVGFWHLDGCSGYCPGCFQRPWCDTGGRLCWPEDEEAGQMFLAEPAKRYVSASPTSLAVLRKLQAEEDEKFERIEKEGLDPNRFDHDNSDNLPF